MRTALITLLSLSLLACGNSSGPSGAGAATVANGSAAFAYISSGTPAPAGGAAPAATPATPAAPAPTPAAPAAPVTTPTLYGTILADPTTGFGGTLYLSGERLIPGSYVEVHVNGVFSKYLPGQFHNAETLGIYVNFTVPADYEFFAIAPDGTRSNAAAVTVAQGTPANVFGVTTPEVTMVYPPSFDTNFTGSVYLNGDGFTPGCTVWASYPNLPPVLLPVVHLNDRTLVWPTATPIAGDMTIQVMNPTGLTSRPVTFTVGQASTSFLTGTFAAPQIFGGANNVSAPFVGPLSIYGADFLPGATLELTNLNTGEVTVTPLLFVSSAEVQWTLVYPQPGAYEAKLVNPDGQATYPWNFDVY